METVGIFCKYKIRTASHYDAGFAFGQKTHDIFLCFKYFILHSARLSAQRIHHAHEAVSGSFFSLFFQLIDLGYRKTKLFRRLFDNVPVIILNVQFFAYQLCNGTSKTSKLAGNGYNTFFFLFHFLFPFLSEYKTQN